ncbi:MAG: alanine racemase [Deltaproteobacteria bacterium]|nr:alanine racemase [Deltaproteobacteria bacterium]
MEKRPTAAYINVGALKHNYSRMREMIPPDVKMMARVKANAYGHGDAQCARIFEDAGCDSLGVALPEEGAALRKAGIKLPIVVLGGIFPGQIKDIFELDLTPVVFDISTARLLSSYARSSGKTKDIHVKLDTGMGRLGLLAHQIAPFFNALKDLPGIRVQALISHFSESEDVESSFTKDQLNAFVEIVEEIKELGFDPEFIDMANSAAAMAHPDTHLNLVRPGISLYGAYPSPALKQKADLKPALQLKTRILLLKNVPAGFFVSYGRKFATTRESVIATLPIGYADGVPRRLSGVGSILVRGKKCPITGVVTMDMTMCDVTDVPDVTAGDEAVIIGSQGPASITVEDVAAQAGTISYEILCNISGRVPRIYV